MGAAVRASSCDPRTRACVRHSVVVDLRRRSPPAFCGARRSTTPRKGRCRRAGPDPDRTPARRHSVLTAHTNVKRQNAISRAPKPEILYTRLFGASRPWAMLRDDAMPCNPSVLSMPVAGDGGSDSRPPHLLPLLGGVVKVPSGRPYQAPASTSSTSSKVKWPIHGLGSWNCTLTGCVHERFGSS